MTVAQARALQPGQRLVASEKFARTFQTRHRTARYVGPARREPDLIRVHRDGMAGRETYHPMWWEKAP